jgi:hypothetical protein
VPILLANTKSDNSRYVEACLRCLRTIFKSSQAPISLIYTNSNESDDSSQPIIPHLLSLAAANQPFINKECVANIMASACQVFISINSFESVLKLILFQIQRQQNIRTYSTVLEPFH